jgi:hypothetical protein
MASHTAHTVIGNPLETASNRNSEPQGHAIVMAVLPYLANRNGRKSLVRGNISCANLQQISPTVSAPSEEMPAIDAIAGVSGRRETDP